ncbi:MAG: hypothetical protein FWH26_07305 [Oscillospiraceae bacterium]|nr:hypothetical protein [Oscillospiraceae bacterium]
MKKEKHKKHLRRLLIALSIIAVLAGSLTLYGYIARQNPARMLENNIVKLERIRYIDLPATRFIGMEIQEQEWPPDFVAMYDDMWGRRGEYIPILDAMPEYATEITELCVLTHNNNMEHWNPDSCEETLIGKFMQAGTPVPEGFGYYDLPPVKVGFGVFLGEYETIQQNNYWSMWEKLSKKHDPPYPDGWFVAGVHLDETVAEEGAFTRLGLILPAYKGEF